MTWLFIKSILGNIITFIAENWRVILIVLICLYAYQQKTAHERAVQELALFKRDIAKAVAKQDAENEIKRIKAESAIKSAQLIHAQQIEAIKNEYEKSNKLSDITIRDLRSRLRQSVSDSFNLPEVDTTSIGTSEKWRDNYSAVAGQYKTLIDACTITTADYNALRAWADEACLQVGCE